MFWKILWPSQNIWTLSFYQKYSAFFLYLSHCKLAQCPPCWTGFIQTYCSKRWVDNLQWQKQQAIYFEFVWISKAKFRYSEKATFWKSLPIFWHYLFPPSEELCTLSLYVIQNLITHPNLEDQKHSCSRSTQKERKSSCIKVSKSGRLSQGFMYLL